MKPQQIKELLNSIKERGWVEKDGRFYTPAEAKKLGLDKKKPKTKSKIIRTGGMDDSRNIKNKLSRDVFMNLMDKELGLDVWPEFFFSIERNYRIDYAFPLHKVALEVDGGIWSKGNSGHSSGKGIERDQNKASLLASLGWRLLRVQPKDLLTLNTIELIKKTINNNF